MSLVWDLQTSTDEESSAYCGKQFVRWCTPVVLCARLLCASNARFSAPSEMFHPKWSQSRGLMGSLPLF